MKILLFPIAFLISFTSVAQVQVCLGADVTVCQGQTVTITNCNPGSGSQNTQGINLPNPTVLTLSDDVWSNVVPVGFPFSFYGNTYNNCIIGSNGLISFNTNNANGYCAYSLTGAGTLPNPTLTSALNSIMLAYQDMLPSLNSGTIQYQTVGTAPNRKFVVLYQNVYFYSCTTVCNYLAVVLNETSNTVELHIGNKATCGTFNGGLAIQGIQNASGSAAVITPGRNNSVWTANQDGRLFTPTSPSNTNGYVETQIPYVQINGVNGSQQWGNTLGATFPYNNGVLNVTLIPPGTTGYFLTASACGAGLGAISDTTWITRTSVNATAIATTDYCSAGVGTAQIATAVGTQPFTYNWTPGGQNTPIATGLFPANYACLVTDANGCSTNVNVIVPNSVSVASATGTLVSCPGGADGTATATMNPTSPTVTYNWYDAGGQTTATATGLAAGTYHCEVSTGSGCIDTAEVIITEIPGMIAAIVNQTNVTCNSGNDGLIDVTVSQGTMPYTFSWDNSTSATNIANDLTAGPQVLTITDALGCVITQTGNITEPAPLSVIFITPDATICAESTIDLTANGAGGSSPYTFTWSENGNVIGTGQTITVDPNYSGTVYSVNLTEDCGSPAAQAFVTISFPTDVIPLIVPDKPVDCVPGSFIFTNNSNNGSEIATTEINFGNGIDTIVIGSGSSSTNYSTPGFYTIDVTITSVYGCVYTKTFTNIVEVVENPTASFGMSSNPTSIYETTIQMQDNSSEGVIGWEWFAPGANPISSTEQYPSFNFPEGIIGQYPITLVVTTPGGCVDTIVNYLQVNTDIIFYAPNVFTPDGDQFNQNWKFYVDGIDIYNFDLFIFNRWGEVIWESHDPSATWDGTYDGKILQDGTYTWRANVKDLNSDERKNFQGSITIIR